MNIYLPFPSTLPNIGIYTHVTNTPIKIKNHFVSTERVAFCLLAITTANRPICSPCVWQPLV